ncbi:6-carboxytetrahydropterin synthase QueD [Oceanobacillus caeni]|uniref:6-carboxy-5,6,7,8-tetrahydropterin synthase n=1 Tax=Oceanobacillus caeni TaxID=405946 RepID=A0ABR5MHS8_9BACI|nr:MULTISPECIES: 6-carboxytetrahydropterin synthase QueD [Bacillaceae]KKE80341.1 6-carboxy-5,6,7,8-tetrahydropterin synthase [Bacilli bacterium VT-13-104]PZD83559.1 6-carboxytetrahydropterin synthase QueD [Bacilli bacterium]KPH73603.1 6-carboxy-5,6,7,8-tetrahydropterin synthase [Oceanobacillus caeni]MBU8790572.1 6-carboxytetrahydropterin synthase QueD [Oceanobacillus caeni]MCR1833532.1 6-carboxytetrahydropterin synthase QueD [Oceanobacillus caeni]
MMQQIYPVTEHPYAYELNKDFQFAAAHYVPHEDAGKCQNMHGHTYFTNITIAGNELDHTGFLVNFKKIKDLIHKRFDHHVMNEDTKFSDQDAEYFPTTEVVARTIYEIIQEYLNTLQNKPTCVQVYLRETPTSYCIYRPKEKTL